jgi:hypothetical protein
MKLRCLMIACIAATAQMRAHSQSPVIGALERPQCGDSVALAVRPLFLKSADGWVALNSDAGLHRALPAPITWTVAFDGRSIGSLATLPPSRAIEHFPRDGFLQLAPRQTVPRRADRERRFAGWCEQARDRPLVVVAPANVRDPESWKPFAPAPSMRDTLLPAFRRVVDKAVVCRNNSEKAIPFHFSARDLKVVRGYRNRGGRTIVAIALDERRYGCDGPPGDDWATHWFLLGGAPRLLGVGLDLVDAGDYDGDGASELLFWHSGYNEDGYTLFADSFTQRTDRWWSYH